jgi:cysteinyl-tRNA synthetase
MIERLIANGCGYVVQGHVLFEVAKVRDYGSLSRRSLDEMIAGARVEVAPYKRNPMDFVLWKPSDAETPGWPSPWGRGRPGWHIECSAMAARHLGEVFDIHGGGIDLQFPHHENEIAQTRCAFGTEGMAQVWMHNGFLQVEGQKMSKSLGNFITIHELLETEKFGGRKWPGEVLRLAMLMTHYREPIDFTLAKLAEAESELRTWATLLVDTMGDGLGSISSSTVPSVEMVRLLNDDLNTPEVITFLRACAKNAKKDLKQAFQFLFDFEFLGILRRETVGLHTGEYGGPNLSPEVMIASFEPYQSFRVNKLNGRVGATESFVESMTNLGLEVSFKSHGEAELSHRGNGASCDSKISALITARKVARATKNWAEADDIRKKLDELGIVLKDNPDGTTTWEVKR